MTAAILRELLNYDPSTGVFTWRVKLSPVAPVGSIAGTIYKNGRRYITVRRKRYFASRLAWLYVHGQWPHAQIDHRNLNRSDDRIDNLRAASAQDNLANRGVLRTNLLGVKGVNVAYIPAKARTPLRYRARIRMNNELIHLGYFHSPEEANAAYATAAKRHHGEFARSV